MSNISVKLPKELLDAVRKKPESTGAAVSFAVLKSLEYWVKADNNKMIFCKFAGLRRGNLNLDTLFES